MQTKLQPLTDIQPGGDSFECDTDDMIFAYKHLLSIQSNSENKTSNFRFHFDVCEIEWSFIDGKFRIFSCSLNLRRSMKRISELTDGSL